MRNLLFFITLLAITTTTAQNYDYGTNMPLEDYNFVLSMLEDKNKQLASFPVKISIEYVLP